MDSSRGTTYSEEQKEIKNRPRKKDRDVIALVTAHADIIKEQTTLVNQLIPIDCLLSDIFIEVDTINKPSVEMKIIIGEGSMRGSYTFDVRRGKTKISKEVEIKKGTKLQVEVSHPDEFIAEGVYFSSSIKR